MIGTGKLVLLCGTALGAVANAQEYVYRFEGQRTAGIDGTIMVEYAGNSPTEAKISADLDFSRLDLDGVRKADGNCTNATISEFKWHIHVKWSSSNKSESFGQCGKNLTGNHYDPLKACGPFSEFSDTDECMAKVKSYNCTPASYAKDPKVCEKGDLSGKVGAFKPDTKKKVKTSWVDKNFPRDEENTPEWNIIIHALCGTATPRVACALGEEVNDSGYGKHPSYPAPGDDDDDSYEEYDDSEDSYEDDSYDTPTKKPCTGKPKRSHKHKHASQIHIRVHGA